MKFIKLEILNLASLDRQGGETINFEEGVLGESTIFSIVGPTGSGKSTILDAICLALYNRTPRYPRKKGDRNQSIEIFGELEEGERNRLAPTDSRNILTRGKTEGYSKLTFLANNGVLYRAEWYVRRKRINFDEAVKSLYKITIDKDRIEEQEENWETLPQIIGLDYEQFLRTVLIAQGSFASFLKAKEDERYKLLEKLVGCEELYTYIAAKIKERYDAARANLNNVKSTMEANEDQMLGDEELEQTRQRIEELEEEQRKVNDQLDKVQEAIKWYITDEKHIDNIAKYSQNYERASQALADAKYMIDRLKLHDCTLPAVVLYGEMVAAENNVKAKHQELSVIKHNVDTLVNDIKGAEQVLESLKKDERKAMAFYEEQKPRINNARAIMAEMKVVKKTLNEKKNEQERCEKVSALATREVESNAEAIKKANEKLSSANKDLDRLKEDINSHKEQFAAKVNAATTEFLRANEEMALQDATNLQAEKSAAECSLNDIREAIRVIDNIAKCSEIINSNNAEIESKTERNKKLAEELRTLDIEDLTQELNTLNNTYTLITSENWQIHRQRLTNGEPCPLCGAKQHPYNDAAVFAPVVSELQQLIKSKEELRHQQVNRKDEILKERSVNSGVITAKTSENNLREAELSNHTAAWNAIQSRHMDWLKDKQALESLVPVIKETVRSASQNLSAYNDLVKKVNSLREIKDKVEKDQNEYLTKADSTLRKTEADKVAAEAELRTANDMTEYLITQQVEKENALKEATAAFEETTLYYKNKEVALKEEVGDKDPNAYDEELYKAKEDATTSVVNKENEINRLREQLNGYEGQCIAISRNIKEEEIKRVERNDSIDAWLCDYNANSPEQLTIDVIDSYHSATDDWEAIRQKQKSLEMSNTEAQTLLNNERLAHSNHQTSKPEMSKDELVAKETELKQWSAQELVEANARMQRHNEAAEKIGAMLERRQEAEVVKKEWEEIVDSIGSEGKTLRKIAQCYTLRFLIEHANVEIRKFNSRYELQQVKNSLGIRVIDHDRADDVRDTTSLSGGETFIVSLGLALGLSALSSRNISFGNLFIDEGFGTLDPNALSVVIDSLAMLQSTQGKKVGVISHTNTMTMSDRITTQIRIVKKGSTGSSHIEISNDRQ